MNGREAGGREYVGNTYAGNLWQPVDQEPGSDRGAHGTFDDRSHGRSENLAAAETAESAATAADSAAVDAVKHAAGKDDN